jgi:urease beta subunit
MIIQLVRKPEKKILLGSHVHRQEDNIKIGQEEVKCEGMGLIILAQCALQ